MSNKEKWLTLILLFGTISTEAHSFLQHFYPETLEIQYSLWLSPFFEKFYLSVIWYIKMLFENLLLVIIFFVAINLRSGYSDKMFYIFCINIMYHIFDFISFIWNYKETYQLYWALLLIMTISELIIIFGKRNKLKIV